MSRYPLVAEQEPVLRSEQLKREAHVRVVGKSGQQGCLHTYGSVANVKRRTEEDAWRCEVDFLRG